MLTANYDELTVERLSTALGKKWTTYPGTIAAFIAEMDFGTAPCVIDALRREVDNGFLGYVPYDLETEVCQLTGDWYRQHTGWDVPTAQIHSLPEVLRGLEITLNRYAPRGGGVIVPTPSYMPFLSIPRHFGRDVLEVPLVRRDGRWEYDLEALDAAFQAGGEVLILCNPHNPVGRVLERDELVAISEVVERHGGRVFADEVHAPLVYPGHRHVPYASVNESAAGHTITTFAATKAWNFAGLKAAQILLSNDADIAVWERDEGYFGMGASSLGMIATRAALIDGQPWLDDVITYLDGNRRLLGDLVADRLPGVEYTLPEGTYLTWLDFSNTRLDGDLAAFFRERADVALTSGAACGAVGKRAVRFNIAMPRPLLEQAVDRMARAIASI